MRSQTVSVSTVDGGAAPEPGALDWDQFSRFKHGATAPAWRFAGQMLARLVTATPQTIFAERLVVTASCYKYLPLASVTLARTLAHQVNRRRSTAGLAPVVQTQVYRDQLIEGDYSTMSLRQRRGFIDNDVIRVDAEVLVGAKVLVVDDIRITGFHEARIAELLEKAGVPEAVFVYWAVVDGCDDPTLERRLNQSSVTDLDALERLVAGGHFVLNSRVCKSILSARPGQLSGFLERLPLPVLSELVAGMECNGYAIMPTYREAYESMLSVLGSRCPSEVS